MGGASSSQSSDLGRTSSYNPTSSSSSSSWNQQESRYPPPQSTYDSSSYPQPYDAQEASPYYAPPPPPPPEAQSTSSYNPTSSSSSWNQQQSRYPAPQSTYDSSSYPQPYDAQEAIPYYAPPPPPAAQPTPQSYTEEGTGGRSGQPNRRLDRRYSTIADEYRSLDEVTAALSRAGLESSNLIIGVDYTKSNEWTGAKSFNRKSLHHIGSVLNPYEQAISIIGKTLAAFDEDNMIPCFGFGDASTHDQDVFSFYPDGNYCNGFEEVLSRYREITPGLRLAGPTSFAPIIEIAMTIVEQSSGQYHVLVIIADGQVTRSVDTEPGRMSPQEQKTVDAIVAASKYPLSIVLVGVGDGPWDMMKEFDDNLPAREFDNFQFVNFTEIMMKNTNPTRKETEFALSALMEVPSQYKATIELGMLGRRRGTSPERVALPTPTSGAKKTYNKPSPPSFAYPEPELPPYSAPISTAPDSSTYNQQPQPPTPSFAYPEPVQPPYRAPISTAPPDTSTYDDQNLCPVCLSNKKDMAFGCGHQTCCECGEDLDVCPICRRQIGTRIRLY